MNKLSLIFLYLLLQSGYSCFSQEKEKVKVDSIKEILSVSAGFGILTFNGDIGKGKGVTPYSYTRGGYFFSVEKRFAKDWLAASINLMTGKLAMGERSINPARNNNFESKINQAGIQLHLYIHSKKNASIIPFVSAGFAYATLYAKTDVKYHGDSLYYYWKDGSVRNLPDLPINEVISHYVQRDYNYETVIKGAAKSCMAIPIGAGIKAKIGKRWEANIGVTYHVTSSDEIDGLTGKGKDKYLFSSFSITYNFNKKPKDTQQDISNIDFSSIDKMDLDNDGVKDADDRCPDTPKGVKVNEKGCPIDGDNDGIPDYQDKESHTHKGSLVDKNGEKITRKMMLEKAKRDSIASKRKDVFMDTPSSNVLEKLDKDIKNKKQTEGKTSKIPEKFQSADANHDGIISSSEITAVIDNFFDGTGNYTVEKINDLIDFFFEQ